MAQRLTAPVCDAVAEREVTHGSEADRKCDPKMNNFEETPIVMRPGRCREHENHAGGGKLPPGFWKFGVRWRRGSGDPSLKRLRSASWDTGQNRREGDTRGLRTVNPRTQPKMHTKRKTRPEGRLAFRGLFAWQMAFSAKRDLTHGSEADRT